ncbi:gluconate 2-dehydrogenase subunit 3 family protein [Cytobacillus sp. Hz8]|uniref:gluconate 2-dehydrogenase subunit 3 family protein n=1 Tax=Cytobacillus sp. Hz8 TaxID=3347168 RepID=UPI0035D691C8
MSEDQKKDISRRSFIKNAGFAVGGVVVGGGIVGSLYMGKSTKPEPGPVKQDQHEMASPEPNKALMFFTPEQFQVIDAASERIFPKDENGPGAKDLLVAYFIDHQLAGTWGNGAKEYTHGPFFPGEATQGYQGRLNRQEIFQIGIQGLQDQAQAKSKKAFYELTEEEQDTILTSFEKGEVQLKGISASHFFSILRGATLEGAYSDPLYGGNRNMEGWKMKNFPGHQGTYANIIEKDFVKIKPKSLNSQHSS